MRYLKKNEGNTRYAEERKEVMPIPKTQNLIAKSDRFFN